MKGTSWKTIALYGAALAAGTVLLQWLDFQRVVRANAGEAVIGLVAFAFLALGVYAGARMFAPAAPAPAGNPQARAALGISGRELQVLQEIAAGHSNKEIAARLNLSPHTVKTHVAHLLEKLEARRRTEAIQRARELGLVA
jgi:DNA-binding CsgD family transcriptional regulator